MSIAAMGFLDIIFVVLGFLVFYGIVGLPECPKCKKEDREGYLFIHASDHNLLECDNCGALFYNGSYAKKMRKLKS